MTSWEFIAARQEHIVSADTVAVLYDGREQTEPTPREFHTPDCPGCWADQWRESDEA